MTTNRIKNTVTRILLPLCLVGAFFLGAYLGVLRGVTVEACGQGESPWLGKAVIQVDFLYPSAGGAMLDEPAVLKQVEECLRHPTRVGRCCIDTFNYPQLRVWFEDGTYDEIFAIRLKGGRVFLYCSQSYIYAMTGMDEITARLINMTETGPDWENSNVKQDSTNDDKQNP